MAITTTWSVKDMTHKDSDGGVSLVYWSLTATDGTYSAQEGGKLRCTADPSASDYIAYADLKESDVLGWVYDSLKTGDETAAEAKKRIEDERTAKVQGQIDRAAANSNGVPW
jgi:hypothetical protein